MVHTEVTVNMATTTELMGVNMAAIMDTTADIMADITGGMGLIMAATIIITEVIMVIITLIMAIMMEITIIQPDHTQSDRGEIRCSPEDILHTMAMTRGVREQLKFQHQSCFTKIHIK